MTDKDRLQKAHNAIVHNVSQKLNRPSSQLTPQDIQQHGLLVKRKGMMGDPENIVPSPFHHVFDENVEEGHDPWEDNPDAYNRGEGEHPYQAEPGDFYSENPIQGNLEFIHGPAMMRVFKRNGVGLQRQTLEQPRSASLIGSMRDGYGRFARSAPWEPGAWGKGIYYPETGALQTWADDRTHLDVWGDDENANQPGSAHHILIRPNGTVRDQGAFDRNFGDAEGDVEGLHRALGELDPRLRLDPSNTWDFGPTEPMEEEPSSVSRGEDGGNLHGVQTGSDYAGGL